MANLDSYSTPQRMGSLLAAMIAAAVCGAPSRGAEYDVVVYGGTSAAVTAAVEVARMGKSVVIVSPDRRLGGLTSNGLGWTDIGNRDAIGGLSREFYNRVYDHYLDDSAWDLESRQAYINRSSLDPDTNREMMFTFEPKIAEGVFNAMAAEHNIPVVAGRLDRETGVARAGKTIQSIRTLEGQTFSAPAFIDATYEGDLMAAAGVSYTIGREANSKYNETLNGIQTARAVKNQLPCCIDPYNTPGDASSGLLPGVNPDAGGPDGAGDKRLQAYNYRMVLTNNPANRTPVPQPTGYDEKDYEILFRAIEAGQSNRFFKFSPMPNNKTDSNNDSGASTDFIGGNYTLETGVNFAEADYDTREEMLQAHRDYQQGFVWTLQNHPRVPASIRNSMDDWGLPLDEFVDNGHWPDQIYVREGRRMVGDFVITESHVNQEQGFEQSDSIGMGGYAMDSHNVQYHVSASGYVVAEGDVQVNPAQGPYPISYRAIVPKQSEVQNLLVPVAVSSSHIAFGSLRMEPVFMSLGQAAGVAAVAVGEHGVSAQDMPYAMLRSRLVRQDAVLGVDYVSADPGVLLNFGAVVADNANSPGHALGGAPGVVWNLMTGDANGGLVDSLGASVNLTVDLGKSLPGQQSIDWDADGFSVISQGTATNFGVYSGNASSALFVDDGKSSSVDLGVRLSGLAEGVYDVFLSAKNTNTSASEGFNVYGLVVDSSSEATDYEQAAPHSLAHDTTSAWRHGSSTIAQTFKVETGQDVVLVVEGLSDGELRGFINTLEIVKLAGSLSADINGDGLIDVADFTILQSNFLSNVPVGLQGDANSDGRVDHRDFYFWRSAYVSAGGDLALLDSLNVPEPAAAAYALAAMLIRGTVLARPAPRD
ncbi:FAD-dependent oxidoreductase [Botrimarina mediterranea]|nr:FAD-dependent oxidoreductase [Botrimarina mediterranea]